MKPERILSLDISSKTGWAVMVSSSTGILLEDYGMIPAIHQPKGAYPGVFVDWAEMVFDEILKLINKYKPDILSIEETVAGSKGVYSQKILEFSHFLLAKFIRDNNIKAVYLLTGAWRSEVGSKMTKEETKHNKYVKEYKEKHNSKFAYDINGKRIGKKTKKHINIRTANEIFADQLRAPLRKKNEDEADAILLAFCLHLRRLKGNDKAEEMTFEDLIKDTK
jgi:Holliday junction resolvasome RuvABC endonuclease subunit